MTKIWYQQYGSNQAWDDTASDTEVETIQSSAASPEDDIVAARRLSTMGMSLGTRCQAMVQKCLQCNFGFGTDLAKEELQRAVHENGVCALEEMIASLDLDE